MRKTLAILLATATLVSATAAQADDWRYHHGPRPGYGGGGGGNNWVAPLVGGLIVGGILGGMAQQNQQQYYGQPYYGQPYQPQVFCRMEAVFDQWGNYMGRQRRCYQQ
jgi:hypothetical protein